MTQASRKQSRRGSLAVKSAVALVVIAGLGTGAYVLARSEGLLSSSGAAVDSTLLATAQVQAFDVTATASGELEAKNQVELENPLDTRATIAEIVPEGTEVKKDAVLVRLNTDEIENQLRQERLALTQAETESKQARDAKSIQLSENASRALEAQLRVDLAELALERWRDGEVAKRREQLRIALERADRELDRLTRKHEKSESLLAQGFMSQDEFERLEIELKQAEANKVIADLDIEIYETYQYPEEEQTKQSEVDKAKASQEQTLAQNSINLSSKEAAVTMREEQERIRRERVTELEQQLAAAEIRAPNDGLVVYGTTINNSRRWDSEGPYRVGSEVRPGELLIVLPDISEMVASVRVHESLASRVRKGQTARVKVEAVDGEFTGTVESIGVLAEGGGWMDRDRREYTVKINLDPGQPGLADAKPSMRSDATIVLESVAPTLAVPIQSVFAADGVRFVCVPEGNKFARVPVRVGRRSDTFAEILAGIDEGTRVLLRRPEPGEVLSEEWSDDQLELAGYTRNEQGEVILATPERPQMPAGMSMNPGGGRPTGQPGGGQRRVMRSPG